MRTKTQDERLKQFLADRNEALLSMDREMIVSFRKKYNGNEVDEPEDEHIFWISVHKARTASLGLPEVERRISMNWLTVQGYEHYATDLAKKDESLTLTSGALAYKQ